jgi:uncharacterized protein
MSTGKKAARLLGFLSPQTIWRMPTRVATTAVLRRPYSSDGTPSLPPLLKQVKGDLKAAMKAKDANRLSVLRSILSAATNAAKTSKPLETDAQVVQLIRKTQRVSLDGAADYRKDGREDLAEMEEAQAKIMDEYISASSVKTLGEAELQEMVEATARDGETDGFLPFSEVMKKMLVNLDGYDVDKKEVARVVRETLGQK